MQRHGNVNRRVQNMTGSGVERQSLLEVADTRGQCSNIQPTHPHVHVPIQAKHEAAEWLFHVPSPVSGKKSVQDKPAGVDVLP